GSSIYVWDGSSLTVNGGTVTGSSSLYLNSGSALALVVNNRAGIVQVSGNLAIDPTASLQLSFGAGLTGSDFIPLIQYGGALSGTFAGLAEGAQFTVGEQVFNLTYTGGDNNNIVGLTAVPEPATMGLLVIGAAGAVIRRRAR
ncbi:MAG: PEP-CTERM sorting domain-containing protein, partial [Planctomycetes bacterium]|nr:PEP-CTERM sorting domain-containing protein [Planctomycetota bacterium]